MDEETRRRTEYEEQFYGMSSSFFAESFKCFLKDEISSKVELLLDNFMTKIIGQAENVETFKIAISDMRQCLMDEYNRNVDETFKEGEKEISDILNIPSNVLVKEDLPIKNGINGDINEVKQDIQDLTEVLQSLLYLKQQILEELQDADTAIMFMETYMHDDNINFNILPVDQITELLKENKLLINSL
ncbi:hypothetical protein RUM43_013477 [Polyplax serrata]|uniref:Protein MIS12 homolog n=1 Tax=Polyplax serrata TaxID=468196 RepID=A0AAN8P0Q3_POLSC